jgi:hypothetical protein
VAAVSAADRLINQRGYGTPQNRRDHAVRVRVKIRVEHAACREAFDHAQLLNPEQNQSRPDVIEKLHRHEQNPERNFVSFRSARKSNAVMSDKHFCLNVEAFVPNAFLSALDTSAATTVAQLAT